MIASCRLLFNVGYSKSIRSVGASGLRQSMGLYPSRDGNILPQHRPQFSESPEPLFTLTAASNHCGGVRRSKRNIRRLAGLRSICPSCGETKIPTFLLRSRGSKTANARSINSTTSHYTTRQIARFRLRIPGYVRNEMERSCVCLVSGSFHITEASIVVPFCRHMRTLRLCSEQ